MRRIWPLMTAASLLLTGCSLSTTAAIAPKPPSVRQMFLSYVPPNEPGAPHDMEWIIEHALNDGGYYGTKYFPGTLSVSPEEKIDYYVDAIGYTTAQKPGPGYIVTWTVPGITMKFFMFRWFKLVPADGGLEGVLTNTYAVSAWNSYAKEALSTMFTTGS